MPIQTTDFASLTDDLEQIFNEVAKAKVAESVGFKLFNVFDNERKTYDYLALHGVSGIQKLTEGADFPEVSAVEGKTSGIALVKSLLINGENLKNAIYRRFKTTPRKALSHLQRLSEETIIMMEATVRTA